MVELADTHGLDRVLKKKRPGATPGRSILERKLEENYGNYNLYKEI